MVQSDALSRRPDLIPDEDNDNEDVIMLPDNLFINLIDTDLQQRIADCDMMDKDAMDALTTLLKHRPTTIKNDLNDWTMEKFRDKNILFFKGKNYIPLDGNLQKDIAKMFHDLPTAGHPGKLETFNSN